MVLSASWKFDVDFRDGRDPVIFTGDGAEDIASLLNAILSSSRVPRILADVGALFSNYIIVTIDDVYALQSRYLSYWGTVNKPPYWDPPRGEGSAVEL